MKDDIQYIVDEKGMKRSVIVPFDRWRRIIEENTMLQNKLKVFCAVREGLEEIKEAGRQGKKLQTLTDFIDESNSQSNKKL